MRIYFHSLTLLCMAIYSKMKFRYYIFIFIVWIGLISTLQPLYAFDDENIDNYFEHINGDPESTRYVRKEILHRFLASYLITIRNEYAYYAHTYDDDSYFPVGRKQRILSVIEEKYLQRSADSALFCSSHTAPCSPKNGNLLYNISNVPMARLLLYYGADLFDFVMRANNYYGSGTISADMLDVIKRTVPLIGVTKKTYRENVEMRDIVRHNRAVKIMTEEEHQYLIFYASEDGLADVIGTVLGTDLPSNTAIKLAKLYLALGTDIHATTEQGDDALFHSLYYVWKSLLDDGNLIGIDEKHRADNVKAREINKIISRSVIHYYRTPVTYWLEEFIEREYPIEMLDSHALLYPRFMESASLDEIQSMTENPQAHKIAVNINCPYRGVEAETDGSADENNCPLIPSINMRDAMGRTPLHIAGEQGNEDVFNYLKNNGADASIMDYRNNLAILKTN